MIIDLYNTKAEKIGDVTLNDDVFAQEYNEALIHQVIVAQMANKRQGTKSTLTRSEVRGGGIKPWRQKGTGRARQGSIRSPQWVKGGVVFAPKPRDFSQKINKRMRWAATSSALSKKLADNEVIVVDKFDLEEGKTKLFAAILNNFKIDKKVLVITDGDNDNVIRAARNIPNVKVINSDLINCYDLVANSICIATEQAMKKIEEVYAGE